MKKQLIICEKSSVASAVARALGVRSKQDGVWEDGTWIVAHARGHLVETADPKDYDARFETWCLEDLPIIPESMRWDRVADTAPLLLKLHALIARDDVIGLVNACDAAREGELIFKTILRTAPLGNQKPVRRAWFASMTIGAIRRAFEELRPDAEMAGLEAAAFARQRSDWLVGINASRAATVRAGRARGKALSLGRVQTPTLAVLVAREREINAYVPTPWWRLELALESAQGPAALVSELVPEQDIAEAAKKRVETVGEVRVTAFSDEVTLVPPPLPFDLTELQAAASDRFGMSAARTLKVAQQLYEAGYLSYPRTDSRYLTGDLLARLNDVFAAVSRAVPDLADACSSAQALAAARALPTRCVNNSRVRDHHAIIPTEKTPENLGAPEQRLYELVARRTLAAFAEPAQVRQVELTADAGGLDASVKKRRVLTAGWTTIEPGNFDDDGLDAVVGVGQAGVGTVGVCTVAERCQPRPRAHSDATLLAAMRAAGRPDDMAAYEWQGIGTPATRAEIIEKLIRKRFAMRPPKNGNLIAATDTGVALITAIEQLPLADAKLTADWERRLSALQDGASPAAFDHEIDDFVRDVTALLIAAPIDKVNQTQPLGNCPRCGTLVMPDDWKFACQGFREKTCDFVVWRWRGKNRVGQAEAGQRLRENRPHKTSKAPDLLLPQSEPSGSLLSRYADWQVRALKADDIEAAIMEIVAVEQPVVIRRITRLVGAAVGLQPQDAKKAVNRSTAALVRLGRLVEMVETDEAGQQPKVLRLPDADAVKLRQRGPRDIEEIPIVELAAALADSDDICSDLDLPEDDARVDARIALARQMGAAEDDS